MAALSIAAAKSERGKGVVLLRAFEESQRFDLKYQTLHFFPLYPLIISLFLINNIKNDRNVINLVDNVLDRAKTGLLGQIALFFKPEAFLTLMMQTKNALHGSLLQMGLRLDYDTP